MNKETIFAANYNEEDIYNVNDIEVIYNKEREEYELYLETAIAFSEYEEECNYLKTLLGRFKEYIDKEGIQEEEYTFFLMQPEIKNRAKTISELYMNFKLFVTAYCNIKEWEKW